MNLVFFGTSEFAVPPLRALAGSRHHVLLVVTQPDRPAGRGRHAEPPPVKVAAQELAMRTIQPERVTSAEFRTAVETLHPDAFVVVSFGQILRPKLMAIPRLGAFNIHASLLPRHRGASPIQAQILEGDDEVGVTVMKMDAGLDTGPIVRRRSSPALKSETAGELHDRLASVGAELIVEVLDDLEVGGVTMTPQNDALATTCGLISKSAGRADFDLDASVLERRIRAYRPWPGISADLVSGCSRRRVQIEEASASEVAVRSVDPGTVVEVQPSHLTVACGRGALDIRRLKPAGKRSMTVGEFLNGTPVRVGDRFESPAG